MASHGHYLSFFFAKNLSESVLRSSVWRMPFVNVISSLLRIYYNCSSTIFGWEHLLPIRIDIVDRVVEKRWGGFKRARE